MNYKEHSKKVEDCIEDFNTRFRGIKDNYRDNRSFTRRSYHELLTKVCREYQLKKSSIKKIIGETYR